MRFKTKVVLVVILIALMLGVPPGLGQQPPAGNRENLYSIWMKLSMMGHNQSEIEGILSGITEKQLQLLKNRLRRDVMDTLTYLNLRNEIELSSTERDLVLIRDKRSTVNAYIKAINPNKLSIPHKFTNGAKRLGPMMAEPAVTIE